MTFLIQQTLIYAVPLMIVALAGVFAERSGIINLALEGIMIFGAFAGVLFVNVTQKAGIFSEAKAAGDWVALQGFMLLAMLVAAILGAVFSLLLSFASVNLKADQTIGGTALNLMAPALVLFFIRIIANQNTLQMAEGDAASWFMLKKSFFGFGRSDETGLLRRPPSSTRRIWPPTSVSSCFRGAVHPALQDPASDCGCAPVVRIHRRPTPWASTSM